MRILTSRCAKRRPKFPARLDEQAPLSTDERQVDGRARLLAAVERCGCWLSRAGLLSASADGQPRLHIHSAKATGQCTTMRNGQKWKDRRYAQAMIFFKNAPRFLYDMYRLRVTVPLTTAPPRVARLKLPCFERWYCALRHVATAASAGLPFRFLFSGAISTRASSCTILPNWPRFCHAHRRLYTARQPDAKNSRQCHMNDAISLKMNYAAPPECISRLFARSHHDFFDVTVPTQPQMSPPCAFGRDARDAIDIWQ